jgi:peptide/nickel transport system permease protein
VTLRAASDSPLPADAAGHVLVEQGDVGYWRQSWRRLRSDRQAMCGLVICVLLVAAAVLAPVLAPHSPSAELRTGLTKDGSPLPPGSRFLLGTDYLGRDELSRLLYGARVSLAVGIGSNVLAAIIGILVGGAAALGRGFTETVLMRFVDVILSLPVLLVSIALLAVTSPNVEVIIIIIGVNFGAYLARLVFSQAAILREREFVLAARSYGVRSPAILARHILPHVLPSVLVFSTLGVATAIQLEAALSYVGIGIQPPTASWGNMISDGQNYITVAAWLVIFPGIAIMVSMIGFSLLGDGLRDGLDPTLDRQLFKFRR